MVQNLSIMLIMAFLSPVSLTTTPPKDNLQVHIQGFDLDTDTKVWVSVFSREGFLKEPIQSKFVPVSGNKLTLTFDLPQGDYAVSTYQDTNRNGKLDRRFYGPPKEPYGFSNEVKPSFGPPKYDRCKFEIKEIQKTITINLIK